MIKVHTAQGYTKCNIAVVDGSHIITEDEGVFRAVSEGADAIMLTGETAAGNYPVAAMEYFVKTADCALKYFT